METPVSARRVTRSQAMAALNSTTINPIPKKVECSEHVLPKSQRRNPKQQDLSEKKQQDRSILVDITNDSPIVGLAKGSLKTPLSSISKQRRIRTSKTPGSGEALLRGQVKTLLQKVEEKAEISRLSFDSRPFLHLRDVVNSPIGLLAPTPANTPEILILPFVTPSEIIEEKLILEMQEIGQSLGVKNQEILESGKSLITMLDFSEKTESSFCSSGMTYEGGYGENKSAEKQSTIDDDNSSIWSIQGNPSTYEEDDEGKENDGDEFYEDEKEEEGDDSLFEELCKGMNRISMNEKGISAMFEGKHTRFIYDSEDEVMEEEEVCKKPWEDRSPSVVQRCVYDSEDEVVEEEEVCKKPCEDVSPSVVRLKGLPTPKGKHFRFSLEDIDMDS